MSSLATKSPKTKPRSHMKPVPTEPLGERGVTPASISSGALSAAWNFSNIPVRPASGALKLTSPDDRLESEADRMAERATGGSLAPQETTGISPLAQVPQTVQRVMASTGIPLDAQTRNRLEPRFGRSFANVRIHADAPAAASARSLDAQAYTVGQHIAFARDSYAPTTADGEKLLAHELAHTLQQGRDGTVRRRRIPDAVGAAALIPPAGGTDTAAHAQGLLRLLRSAWSELSAANQLAVRTQAVTFGIAAPTEVALFAALATGSNDQLLKFAAAIRTADPTTTLGDPALIDTGARTGTPDVANIVTLVAGADKIFNAVAAGTQDADLSDVFGPSNVAKAKKKFANARLALHRLQAAKKIVTDRSGYNAEVGLGGLTNPDQLAVAPGIIDSPTATNSIVTTVHESMHAGNTNLKDFGYLDTGPTSSFSKIDEATKLNNAADYEVIAFRILDPADPSAFPGQKFIPAGATVGGVSAPPLTKQQAAIKEASETYRRAWTTALNLHTLFVRVFKHPADWNTVNLGPEFGVASGTHFAQSLPFWSKVENMTIHHRPGIAATAGNPSSNPVTLIDVAQSESVIRKLSDGMEQTNDSNLTEADAVTLETKADATQQTKIAKSAADEAKVLVSLVRSEKLGEITGRVERDERAVDRLSKASLAASFFDDVLAPQSPSSFTD